MVRALIGKVPEFLLLCAIMSSSKSRKVYIERLKIAGTRNRRVATHAEHRYSGTVLISQPVTQFITVRLGVCIAWAAPFSGSTTRGLTARRHDCNINTHPPVAVRHSHRLKLGKTEESKVNDVNHASKYLGKSMRFFAV